VQHSTNGLLCKTSILMSTCFSPCLLHAYAVSRGNFISGHSGFVLQLSATTIYYLLGCCDCCMCVRYTGSPDSQGMTFLMSLAANGSDACYFGEMNGIFYIVHRSGAIKAYTLENIDQPNCMLNPYPPHDAQVPDTFLPGGFTPNKINNRLYIGCRSARCVYCYDAGTTEGISTKEVQRFVTYEKENEQPQSLSVTPDGRLIVLVALEDFFTRTWRGRLDIYNEKNRLPQTSVNFPRLVDNPWCVTYSDENTFTVSYGLSKFGIMKVNIEGRVIAKSTEQLLLPRGVHYVHELKRIFVVDAGRGLFLEMDPELEVQRRVYDWKLGDSNENSENLQPMRFTFNCRTLTSLWECAVAA
jgi:hypothetical protein